MHVRPGGRVRGAIVLRATERGADVAARTAAFLFARACNGRDARPTPRNYAAPGTGGWAAITRGGRRVRRSTTIDAISITIAIANTTSR